MRKVVHFIDSADFGGTEQALLHVLRGLDPECWQAVLFYHPEPRLTPLLEGARDLNIKLQPVPPMAGKQVITAMPQFFRVLRDERPDVFHAHLNWPLACKYGLLTATLARVPAVVATCQLFVDPLNLRSARSQYRVVAAGVDRFIAVSGDVAKRLQQTLGVPARKIRVVHNAIPLAFYRKSANQALRASLIGDTARPFVLTSARLEPQKGLCYLLEAAALVPHAMFVLAGEGHEREKLQLRTRELGLEGRVLFLGYRQDIPDLLACCDLFVLPSLVEGLPLSILEAMAAGKPVISSAIGGTDEAVVNGDTGLLVPPANAVELARAVNSLLSNPTLAERLAAAGKARVEREFSAATMVQRIAQIYEELLPCLDTGGCD